MKIVMFTPAARRSAIGRVAAMITGQLTDGGHDVVVVRTETDDDEADVHDFGVTVVSWRDDAAVVGAVLDADVAVYQIGDNYLFHAGALAWMPRMPGIVCLHDYFVGDLFLAWCRETGSEPDSVIRGWYGDDAVAPYRSAMCDGDFVALTASSAPLTEWVCAKAFGVITHSAWDIERVTGSCPGPIRIAALPYQAATLAHRVDDDDTVFNLVTIGHVNRNKRIDDVIRAIGASRELASVVVYTLVGPVDPKTTLELSALARRCGVRLIVRGAVSDPELAQILADSDAVAALRWPCLEAASASVIEAMLAGKPTIVTRAGFYDELPDDCVVKVGAGAAVDTLTSVIERLVADPVERAAIGERARSMAIDTFRADRYVGVVLDMALDVLAVAPALEVIRQAGSQLSAWGAPVEGVLDHVVEPLLPLWDASVETD